MLDVTGTRVHGLWSTAGLEVIKVNFLYQNYYTKIELHSICEVSSELT